MKSKLKALRRTAFIDILEATLLLIVVVALLAALTVIGVANWHCATWLVIISGCSMVIYSLVVYIEAIYEIQAQYRIDYASAVREEHSHDS